MFQITIRTTALLAVACFPLFFVSGCSAPETSSLTLAFTVTSNESAPSITEFVDLLTRHAESALEPGDGAVTIVTPAIVESVDLTPMRGDEVEANPSTKRARKIAAKLDDLSARVGKLAAIEPGLDPIGVLDRALEATDLGGTVLLETSGYATVAPLDLNAAGNWMSNPEELAASIPDADLPDATDKSITILGLGYPAPGSAQQSAGPSARNALTTIYNRLCERMNATKCTVLNGPAGNAAPATTIATPPVELDQLTTHCVGQVYIDTRLAFAPNSYQLQPTIDSHLAPIARSLIQCPSSSILDAVGHSAIVPGQTDSGAELEHLRAAAILTRLIELGAPTSIIGTAQAGGQLVDNMPGGHFREDLAARNRVVLLTLSPAR
ncbi:hypothetical protein MTX80_23210 (plasmid) [Gordonia amicalis]|nr:hypothetical protein [Gordonia amicalis]UOG23828.1 hypothetical protein MTX80_23210 [Gordonia amicalis]